jgi:hypothetical protein
VNLTDEKLSKWRLGHSLWIYLARVVLLVVLVGAADSSGAIHVPVLGIKLTSGKVDGVSTPITAHCGIGRVITER